MKKITKIKSKKSVRPAALSKDVKNMKPIIRSSLSVFFGMILGVVITGVILERKIESMANELQDPIASNISKNSSQKYPAVAKISYPAAILNVNGSVESVSRSEIKIKTAICQGEKKYIGKITAKTEIIRRERQGDPPFTKDVAADISEIKKNDQVALESYEDVNKETTFEVKKIFIEKSFAAL